MLVMVVLCWWWWCCVGGGGVVLVVVVLCWWWWCCIGGSGVVLVRERRKEEVEGKDVYIDSQSPEQGWLVLLCLTIQCSIADSGIVTGIDAGIVMLNS
jgi:protein-S-isoprenylcysteine O-methyltransferase Ste14